MGYDFTVKGQGLGKRPAGSSRREAYSLSPPFYQAGEGLTLSGQARVVAV